MKYSVHCLQKTCKQFLFTVFIARQHTDARYWYSNSVCLSVRPSVTCWYCTKMAQHIVSFFHHVVGQSFQFYQHQTSSQNSDWVTPCEGAKYRWGIKIMRFSTNKSLYLANDTRYRHSYYGRRIGKRTQAFEWHQFQLPWETSKPDFKVTILFNVK